MIVIGQCRFISVFTITVTFQLSSCWMICPKRSCGQPVVTGVVFCPSRRVMPLFRMVYKCVGFAVLPTFVAKGGGLYPTPGARLHTIVLKAENAIHVVFWRLVFRYL